MSIIWAFALICGATEVALAGLFGDIVAGLFGDTNCEVSPWSEWSGHGFKIQRFRTILVSQSGAGSPCPHLNEIQKSQPKISLTARSFRKRFLRRHEAQARDLLVILDSSGSIGPHDFTDAKTNFNELISKLCPPGDSFRPAGHAQFHQLGLLTFSSIVKEEFDFDDRKGLTSIHRGISNATYFGGNTCTGDAFEKARLMFAAKNKGVRNSPVVKEALILTDGRSNCGTNAIKAAKELTKSGVRVFALAIKVKGQNNQQELEKYVSEPAGHHLFAIDGFEQLKNLTDEVIRYANTVQCVPLSPEK